MTQMFVLVSLIAMTLGEAAVPAVATAAPAAAPVTYTTTPAGISCDTPLCQGLVGAGVGVAGLAAIGGIAGALAHKKHDHHPLMAKSNAATTAAPVPVITAAPAIFAREENTTAPTEEPWSAQSNGWIVPLLILVSALLIMCCLFSLIMSQQPKTKRATKVKKSAPAPANRDVAVAPLEAAPLLGHWEQPTQIVPVTTAQASMVPQMTTSQYAMAAPTYTETVAPSYAMMPTPGFLEAYAMGAPPAPAYANSTGGAMMGEYAVGYPGGAGGYSPGVFPGYSTRGLF